jgi:hypothetical protein
MAAHPDTKIDCSKVYVKRSSFATEDNEFDGAFAAVAIKKGRTNYKTIRGKKPFGAWTCWSDCGRNVPSLVLFDIAPGNTC